MTTTLARPYAHEYFVTVRGRASKQVTTRPMPDRETAVNYLSRMVRDPHFYVPAKSFDWFVTVCEPGGASEMSVKFNCREAAEDFVNRVDEGRERLVVIEYNFVIRPA